ncbi:MAG: hybrid sensor histidine kinase/response regulator [Candidatus Scalindua sp.]|nr:hybrid sensor histidine kinase/response regulator [Candidatus Scalindua sp.]
MAFDKSKFTKRFVEDCREYVIKINNCLLCLEKTPDNSEAMNEVFRSVHSIKGASNMLKFLTLAEISHNFEDVLDSLRKEKITHSKSLSDLFFRVTDIIEKMIELIAEGKDDTIEIEEICKELKMVAQGKTSETGILNVDTLNPVDTKSENADTGLEDVPDSDDILKELELTSATDSKPAGNQTEPDKGKNDTLSLKKKQTDKSVGQKVDETIRISAIKLDETIKLMEEMVSLQSKIKQRLSDFDEVNKLSKKNIELINHIISNNKYSSNNGHNDEIVHTAQLLHQKLKQQLSNSREDVSLQEILTGELQEKALRMRMMPISTVFDTFSRPIRDIAVSFDKKVSLVIKGEETELDKKMIEKISDPLMHMLRNSIDHGIETPEERLKVGKSETGTINMTASYEGGAVLIELSDDGRGVSIDNIKERAIQRKLISEEKLTTMSESEIVDLIFVPGFSTSPIITDISGRGVGMDVVKSNIVDRLSGSIQTKTKKGEGSAFLIRLPLTLGIMRIVSVAISDLIFAISENSISEIIRIPQAELIDVVDKKAIRLREQIIPVVELHSLLKLPGKRKIIQGELLILVVFMGSAQLGLIVDSIINNEDMVIKPLPSHMQNNQWVSGVTISGKNEVVSILHVSSIIEAANEMKVERHFGKASEKKEICILLADDSFSTREVEKSILESYGYKVDMAVDGQEALDKAKEYKYDVVITDIEMPRLDGFSLTEKLRNESEYEHTPVIIVSSRDKEEDKKRGIRVGADAYIVKGAFDQSNLLETVQHLVGS